MEYLRLLGSGGQARIFLVREKNRLYACKESEKKELLKRESGFLKLAEHKRFPCFADYREGTKKGFLFMEYVEGIQLGKSMCERGIPEYREALRILVETAEGIAFLHDRKKPIIHRDIKPENIMIQKNGAVKIIDLGCACFADGQERSAAGTKGYAPREQLKMEGQGLYSDVYAFGRLMHFLFTGDNPYLPPYEKPDVRKYDRSFDCDLAALITACVREECGKRPPDMRYVLQELKKIAEKKKKWVYLWRRKGLYQREFVYEKNILLK